MIWVTLIFIGVLDIFGFVLMLFPGILPKFVAIPTFIYSLPLIAGRQVIWTENPLAIQTIALPFLVSSVFFSFQTMLVYIATVNFLEQPHARLNRDYLGRKKPSIVR